MRMADSDDSAYICRRLHIIIFIMNRRSLLLVSAFVMTLSAFGVDDEGARPILPDTSRVFDLDEVTVISQPKESYRMRMQPLSSSMYDEEQLNSLSIGDLRELSSYVPSFAMPNVFYLYSWHRLACQQSSGRHLRRWRTNNQQKRLQFPFV